jgi:hypothetical protein
LQSKISDGSSVVLISFTISSSTDTFEYQAEKGMTWNDWVTSDYSPNGTTISFNRPYINGLG